MGMLEIYLSHITHTYPVSDFDFYIYIYYNNIHHLLRGLLLMEGVVMMRLGLGLLLLLRLLPTLHCATLWRVLTALGVVGVVRLTIRLLNLRPPWSVSSACVLATATGTLSWPGPR
jgi:hypothetical protein